jgi:ABC-2 type transport system ATP-binding protein
LPVVTPVLEARKLEKRLDNGVVFKDLNVALYPGDFLGIVGPPGVGKSVLVRVMSTLLPLDGGELWVDGVPASEAERVRRSLGYYGGASELFPEMTLREFLAWFARAHGVDDAYVEVRVEEVLTLTRLSPVADDRMARLKRAEQRRAGLARTLVHGPRVILLDDPLARVQGAERDLWVQILERVRNTGRAIVMAAETVREVRHLLTHACVLAAGRILGCGPIDSLDSRVSQLRSIQLQVMGASRAVSLLEVWPGVFQATAAGDIIKVLFMGDSAEVLQLVSHLTTQGLPVVSFRQEPAYLM